MNILYITPYKFIPQNGGGKVAMYNQIFNLSKQHQVTVGAVGELPNTSNLSAKVLPFFSESRLRYLNPYYVYKLHKTIKKFKIEFIILEHPYMGWMLVLLQLLKKIPFAIRSQNVEFMRFSDLGKWWHPIMSVYEKFIHNKASFVLCITEDDKKYFEAQGIQSKLINYPFGTTEKENPSDRLLCKEIVLKQNNLDSNTKLILYNGSLSYIPNKIGLDIILEKLNPILLEKYTDYKIIICGGGLATEYNNLEAFADKNIIFKGFVEDISLYFKAADVFINPVQGGGGIKTKLIDALAFGTTTVSSANGANGVVLETVKDKLFITPDYDATAMANKVIEILDSNKYEPTPALFYAYYNWTNVTSRICKEMDLI